MLDAKKEEVRRKETAEYFPRDVAGYRILGNKQSAQTACM
jgi:hypothetical protein